jgi:diguanylate cyclase (GGDEF)-like protein
MLPQAEQSSDPLTVALIDVDGFEEVNKSHGREGGDDVLVSVARLLRETLPEAALISRYSGDEFAAALPDTPLDDAFTLLEEFRRRVAALRWDEWPGLSVTCSIGLASYPGHGHDDSELARQADDALYNAKLTGRNKVSLPPADSRMVTKTSHYTDAQLKRLSQLAKTLNRKDASLLREALDDLLKKYNDRLNSLPQQ